MGRTKIMVAEDDRGFRELLIMALEGHGFDVLSAANTEQAIVLLKCQTVDLLLLDLRLGNKSGLELLKMIRGLPGRAELPVVLLTGYSNRDSVLEIARLGVQGYVLKSELSHDKFLSRIHQCVDSKSPLQQNKLTISPDPPARPNEDPSRDSENSPESIFRPDALAAIKPITTRAHVLEQLDKCTTLKALSPTVSELLTMTNSSECSLAQIAHVVQRDPGLSLKILQIANSVAYSRAGSVDTEQKALTRIGLAQIRQLLLNISVVDRFDLRGLGEHFDGRLFWEHSIATGLIGAAITRFRGGNERTIDNAFTTGLLHDVARMVLAEQLGEMYKRVLDAASDLQLPLEQVETQMLLANHADLMERILTAWAFPKHLVEPIAMHHSSVGNIRALAPRAIEKVCTLALADRLAHSMLFGSSGNNCLYPIDEFVQILQLTPNVISFVEDRIPQEVNEMKAVMVPSGKDTPWPEQSLIIQEQLKHPIRALYLSMNSAIDGYRIFFERICERGTGKKPNVAVLNFADHQTQTILTKKLLEEEYNTGLQPLPLLILTPLTTLKLESKLAAGRMHKLLPLPFTLSQLIQKMDNLLSAAVDEADRRLPTEK